MNILVLHGPNLNLLGSREPEIYGTMTLNEINRELQKLARKNGQRLKIFQANCEGRLIDHIHEARGWADGLVLNPAAYTHYSYALRDAVAAVSFPAIEVHLSDLKKREVFRRKSVIKDVCLTTIMGHGWRSYAMALDRFAQRSKR